jgi:DNA methyltransferase 1-associated protein 1
MCMVDVGYIQLTNTRVWKGFTNSARDDDLVLYHWINEADESTDRSFAGFNKVVDVVEYTDEEYDRLLMG